MEELNNLKWNIIGLSKNTRRKEENVKVTSGNILYNEGDEDKNSAGLCLSDVVNSLSTSSNYAHWKRITIIFKNVEVRLYWRRIHNRLEKILDRTINWKHRTGFHQFSWS